MSKRSTVRAQIELEEIWKVLHPPEKDDEFAKRVAVMSHQEIVNWKPWKSGRVTPEEKAAVLWELRTRILQLQSKLRQVQKRTRLIKARARTVTEAEQKRISPPL